jgi:hypothetical protein
VIFYPVFCSLSLFFAVLNLTVFCLSIVRRRVSGVASIEEIKWSKQALDCILMASLSWNVQVNDLVLSQNDEIKVRVGEPVNVRVEFRNCCGQAIHYLNLMLDCFQDLLNGKRRYNLNGKKAIVGKDRIHIHQVRPFAFRFNSDYISL